MSKQTVYKDVGKYYEIQEKELLEKGYRKVFENEKLTVFEEDETKK